MTRDQDRMWTIRELMKFSIDHLTKQGFEDPRLNVELLLSHALQCQRISLYTSFDKPLSNDELKRYRALYERRLNREPVQYIVGTVGFMGLQFKVDPRVLIPRPETETLVEQAMLQCKQWEDRREINAIDVGTGSGNIAIALAKFVRRVSVVGIDSSASALEVAKENAERIGGAENVRFELMDAFEPVDQLLRKRFDLLVSNPPYVARDEWETLQTEVRRYEPESAVTDGRDGLEFYRRIVELAPLLLSDYGHVMVEVGYGQADTVQAIFELAKLEIVEIVRDLQGIPRVVHATCRASSRNPIYSN
jgi:release factor glutamine methyltransferase